MGDFLFSTEDKKLHRNFMDSQFQEEAAYARELVANALDSDTDRVEVQILEGIFDIEDYGTGMLPEEVEEFFLQLHSSKGADRKEKIGEHGIGVHSIFSQDPYLVEIETARNGVNTRFCILEDLSLRPLPSGHKKRGTKITIYKTKKAVKSKGLREVKNSPEEKIIRYHCKFHPTLILINGREINRRPELESSFSHMLDGEDLEGEIALQSDGDKSWLVRLWHGFRDGSSPENLQLFTNWILLEELEDDFVKGVVNCDAIKPVISRNRAKRNDSFLELRRRLELEKIKLLEEKYDPDSFKEPDEIHDYLLGLIRSRGISNRSLENRENGGEKDELREKLVSLPLFGRVQGYSISEIDREMKNRGEVVYTRFSLHRDGFGGVMVLQGLTRNEVDVLGGIFPSNKFKSLAEARKEEGFAIGRTENGKERRGGVEIIPVERINEFFSSSFRPLLEGARRLEARGSEALSFGLGRLKKALRLDRFKKGLSSSVASLKGNLTAVTGKVKKTKGGGRLISRGLAKGKEKWGRFSSGLRPLRESDYDYQEKEFLRQLQEVVTQVFHRKAEELKSLKLAESDSASPLFVKGEVFGHRGTLYLNRNHPWLQKAIGGNKEDILQLAPFVLAEGVKERYKVHRHARRARRLRIGVDRATQSLLEEASIPVVEGEE